MTGRYKINIHYNDDGLEFGKLIERLFKKYLMSLDN